MQTYKFTDVNGKERVVSVGDKVLYIDGRVGFIEDICDCGRCLKRGFCEPTVRYVNNQGDERYDYLTDYGYSTNFEEVYKIGDEVFNEKPLIEDIDKEIEKMRERVKSAQSWIKHLENFKKEIVG